jgi:hypothetical protein
MTVEVGVIQQRLPSRPHKPSLPAIAMEGATKGRAKPSIEPIAIPQRQHLVEEQTEHISVGRDRTRGTPLRALTAVERLYRSNSIQWEFYAAAGVLRNLVLNALGGSEGVGAYDLPPGSRAPWEKADRRAEAIGRASGNTDALRELLYAMVGFRDQCGKRRFDEEKAKLLLRACLETTDGIMLADIGKARSEYSGIKQLQAAGSTFLTEALRSGAMHLGLIRAPEWRDGSWRLIDNPAK